MSSRQNNESGLVSIVIVTTIVILLSLVSVGFSKIMDREARQALDRQLSLQAYYAAESGANDTINAIRTSPNLNFNTCSSFASDGNFTSSTFSTDADSVAKYTCLLVNSNVGNIDFGQIQADQQKAYKITSSFNRLTFTWKNNGSSTSNSRTNLLLPPRASWGSDYGLLRATLYTNIQNMKRGPLGDVMPNEIHMFIFPGGSGANDDPLFSSSCNAANKECTANFNGLNVSGTSLLVVKMLYENSTNVNVTADTNLNAQVEIDVTGQANDSVRRIKVIVPKDALDASTVPSFALQTDGDLCKRWRVPVDPAQPITQNCN